MAAQKAALVEQIKGIQRSDAAAKQAWWHHCDTQLGGIKDPNRHDVSVLKKFVTMYQSGNMAMGGAGPSSAAWGGGCGGGCKGGGGPAYLASPMAWGGYAMPPMFAAVGGGSTLGEFIKTGQRQSQSFKTAWHAYCSLQGSRFADPNKHDDQFISDFIEQLGTLASQSLAETAEEQGVDLNAVLANAQNSKGVKRAPPTTGGAPPAKRPVAVAAGGARSIFSPSSGTADAGGEKGELVEQIKNLQRSSMETKQAWWTYCDEQLGGVRDPNRHDVETLQGFLAMHS